MSGNNDNIDQYITFLNHFLLSNSTFFAETLFNNPNLFSIEIDFQESDDEYSSDESDVGQNLDMVEFFKPVPIPLPEKTIAHLAIITYNKSKTDYDKCSICFDKFIDSKIIKSKVRELACKHIYHIKCIDEWFKQHPTCPVCGADQRDLVQSKSKI